MNGVIYCRVSSREQVEGTSLESQEIACREYARSHEIEIVKVFVEQGESAKFADRTQLLELIGFCRRRENGVTKLLVWKVDRFARNVADHYSIKAELLKRGVEVVSVTEPIDGKPEGKLLETILAGFAQFDNDLRAARTINGMRRKIQEGIFPWKPPFGYKASNQPGSKKTEPDIPDMAWFSSLQKAWSMYATGAYTKAEIIRLLSAWGVHTRSGAPIPKQTLDNMLRDPFYAGVIRDPWSGEDHAGRHIPLISLETFGTIRDVNDRRRQTRSVRHQRAHPDFPLRAFARCVQCKRYVTGARTRGRSRYYPYYRCAQRGCSAGSSFATESVHNEFTGFLRLITPEADEIRKLTAHIAKISKRYAAATRATLDRRQIETERLKRRQQQLIQMRMEEVISREEFIQLNSQLSTRILAQPGKAPALDTTDQILRRLEEICAPLSHLEDTWAKLPPVEKQRFQRMILPVGFVIGEIGTAEMSCLFATFKRVRGNESQTVPPTGQFLNRLQENLKELSELFRSAENLQDVPKLAA